MKLEEIVNNELIRIENDGIERIQRKHFNDAEAMRKAEHAYKEFSELDKFGVNVFIGNSRLKSANPCVVITKSNGEIFEIHYNDDILKKLPNWREGLYNIFIPKQWSYIVSRKKNEVAKLFANWIASHN